MADSYDVYDVHLAFVTYNSQEDRYNLNSGTCAAAKAFQSCFNHFAEQRLQGGVDHKRIDADNHAYFQPIEYIGDAVAAVEACLLLQQQSTPSPLLLAVANPRDRLPVEWRKPPQTNQLNSSQYVALTSLNFNLEVVQGPPGTGKSTTIYHLVKHCMPISVKSVVCAVQNRAVEAICQRLASAEGDLLFFVVGNEKRLAETSKNWTLTAQGNRDPRVMHERAVALKATQFAQLVKHGLSKYKEKVFGALKLVQHRNFRAAELNRLIERGAHLGRYGDYTPDPSEQDTLKKASFMNYFEAHDGWKKLASTYTRSKLRSAVRLHMFFKETSKDAEERAAQLFIQAMQEIARDASVMLCTAATVGPQVNSTDENVARYMKSASALIVDEAGTCPDRSIVPLLPMRDSGSCFSRAVLVGDEKQLPPFSRLEESVRNPSLLERAVSKVGGHMLTTQYRMPPSLCSVVSAAFYDGQLATADEKAAESTQMGGPYIVFTPVDGEAESNGRNKSLFNEKEADAAVQHAIRLKINQPMWSVAVITFYKEQFKLINESLLLNGQAEDTISVLSVDAAQGQEFDAVVLSAVVDGSRPSFLRDERRQCVAISRAKKCFIIVANPNLCNNMTIFRSLRNAAR